jgi:cob(I)alamin adenosyltransferase
MELKDVILSTLAEIEEIGLSREAETPKIEKESIGIVSTAEVKSLPSQNSKAYSHTSHEDEMRILDGIRERLLVLFEGFQSPNNVQIEAKVDLTLNFLEYLLATIDNRLEIIKEK